MFDDDWPTDFNKTKDLVCSMMIGSQFLIQSKSFSSGVSSVINLIVLKHFQSVKGLTNF